MTAPRRPHGLASLSLALALGAAGCEDRDAAGVGEDAGVVIVVDGGILGGGGGGGGGGPVVGCGDGVVDPGEECDDADSDEHDACASDCTRTDPPDGAPIEAEENVWTYVPVEGAVCRDGSATGIMVNLSSRSDRAVLFLEGGGACFNAATCLVNPARFEPDAFRARSGLFDRDDPANPVRDASFVFIPYCTGDVHLGDAAAEIPDVDGIQEFRGYRNVARALERLVPTFANASQVLLTGVSAGGFGAAGNFEQVKRAFQGVEVVWLDDSGPAMSAAQIAPCLQDQWRRTWGFDATLLEECGPDCPAEDDYIFDFLAHLYRRYPDSIGAFYSSIADAVIRIFYGFGLDDCDVLFASLSPGDYFTGLEGLRAFGAERGLAFGTYYVEGASHGCLSSDCFYETSVDGVPLTTFVAELLAGNIFHVGPGI